MAKEVIIWNAIPDGGNILGVARDDIDIPFIVEKETFPGSGVWAPIDLSASTIVAVVKDASDADVSLVVTPIDLVNGELLVTFSSEVTGDLGQGEWGFTLSVETATKDRTVVNGYLRLVDRNG